VLIIETTTFVSARNDAHESTARANRPGRDTTTVLV
jgi:hypothetical protein